MKREREESVKKGEMNGVLITVLIRLEHNFRFRIIRGRERIYGLIN
jgi:hypothetical protein